MHSIIEHCSFEWMKKNATKSVPLDGSFWDAWTEVFINTGVNGCWANALTAKEATEYGGACCGATGLQVRALARHWRRTATVCVRIAPGASAARWMNETYGFNKPNITRSLPLKLSLERWAEPQGIVRCK
jgi:hypothetical protein